MRHIRFLALLLALLMLLGLTACGSKAETSPAAEDAQLPAGVDPATGAWIGRGGCFRLEPWEGETGGFAYAGHSYRSADSWDGFRLLRDGEPIYETKNQTLGARATEQGIWLGEESRDGDAWIAQAVLLDADGREQRRLTLPLPTDSFCLDFSADEELLYLNCVDALRLYDVEGAERGEIPHAQWAGTLLRGGDGRLYFVDQGQTGGGRVSAIDPAGPALRTLFDYPAGNLRRGDEAAPFLLIRAAGIDRLQADGSASPLVIWDECGLGVSGVTDVKAQPDGSYLLTGLAASLHLIPAQPEELKARTCITLGVLPRNREGAPLDFAMVNANLVRQTTAFNAASQDSYVQLLDLSEEGTLNAEQALLKLNTRILSGDAPDMLVFDNGSLSPFPFLRKGLLRDLNGEFLEKDQDLSLSDIVIADAVQNDLGGLYLLGSRFSIETRYGLQERFGKVWGWDYETYRQIDRETPAGGMVMYNLTRDYFLRESASRFIRGAIDWKNGVCDFDNDAFIRLLEACRDMRETPEDPNNMVFGGAAELMNGGYMVTALCMLSSPEDYARSCREMGRPLSFIGFPTPDGSSGTDLSFSDAIGVLTSSAHPQECWAFLKYALLHNEYGLPVYRPLLEQRIREAQQPKAADGAADPFDRSLDPPMSDGEVQGFHELLSHIHHTTLYDQTALDIIGEEFAAVLAGDRSAADAARLVQSRLSLYVAEQGG